MNFIEKLRRLVACSDAIEYAKKFPSLQKAWEACERGDWMLWLIGKTCGKPGTRSRKKLVMVSCKCARLAWRWMPREGKNAIRIAEKYCDGKATLREVKVAADAAYAAYAANATYAAYAANAAAYAAADAADVAYAAYAAYAAADAGNLNKSLKKSANIVRKYYPNAPRLK